MATSKKEIDKEYLFRLLMPTSSQEDAQPDTSEESLPLPSPSAPNIPQPSPSVSGLAAGTRLHPARQLVLINLNEQLVADRLDEVFEKFRCCRCDRCRQDVAALALNTLTPRYVVAAPEDIPNLLANCSTKEVSGALVKAILQVKKHPRH